MDGLRRGGHGWATGWVPPPRVVWSLGVASGALLLAASAAAITGPRPAPDPGFTDRLMTAIGASTTGGSVTCDIPGDLGVGRRFACEGTDPAGTYTVEVTITDGHHDFRLRVDPTV